jgi:hypothetical protein
MKRILLIAVFVAPVLAPGVARAEREDRITLDLRGGGLARNDDGYADHASVFGLPGVGLGGGGMVEVGVRVALRIWLAGSWSGFGSVVRKRASELSLMTTAMLAHASKTGWEAASPPAGTRSPAG